MCIRDRVITEAEILGAQTPKGRTPRREPTAAEAIAAQKAKYLASSQPYIAPPPSQKRVLTEAEILGTQTAKGPTPRRGPTAAEAIASQIAKSQPKGKTPTAAEAIAAQTAKAPPKGKAPTAAEAIAAQTSKAKPPPQIPLPWPKNPRGTSPSSTAAASSAAVAAPSAATVSNTLHLAEPSTIYGAFKNYLFDYYDKMNAEELIGALNDLDLRHIGFLFDGKFKPEVIRKKIPTPTNNSVKELVESQETIDLAKAYINNKLREMTTCIPSLKQW